MNSPANDREIVVLRISRRDLAELIDTLREAEQLCESFRQKEHDFRMQRIRLEMLRQPSAPPPSALPPERRESTRYVQMADLTPGRKKG